MYYIYIYVYIYIYIYICMCVKHICTYIHMTRPYVGHDSFMCVTRRH